METENETLNQATESSSFAMSGLQPTTRDETQAEANSAATEDAAETGAAETKEPNKAKSDGAGTENTEKEKPTPFHEHPAWKAFQERKDREVREAVERAARAEAQLESMQGPNDESPGDAPYKDVTEMEDDDLRDWFAEDPKGFLRNYALQLHHESLNEVTGMVDARLNDATTMSRDEARYMQYAERNPDFVEAYENGELQNVIDENPGVADWIAAHKILRAETLLDSQKQDVDAAVAKAVKETEARLRKQFGRETRQSMAVPKGGLPSAPSATDPRLKDSTKFGGRENVMVQRLLERERSAV